VFLSKNLRFSILGLDHQTTNATIVATAYVANKMALHHQCYKWDIVHIRHAHSAKHLWHLVTKTIKLGLTATFQLTCFLVLPPLVPGFSMGQTSFWSPDQQCHAMNKYLRFMYC